MSINLLMIGFSQRRLSRIWVINSRKIYHLLDWILKRLNQLIGAHIYWISFTCKFNNLSCFRTIGRRMVVLQRDWILWKRFSYVCWNLTWNYWMIGYLTVTMSYIIMIYTTNSLFKLIIDCLLVRRRGLMTQESSGKTLMFSGPLTLVNC